MYEKAMIEKKNDLITRADEIVNKAKAETRELTDAEAAELAEIRDNVRKIVEKLKLIDEIEVEKGMEKKPEAGEVEKTEEEIKTETEQREERAFEDYIRNRVTNERANNMTFDDNGAVIPTTIADRIIKKVYDICPILERSTKYNVKGTLEIPYYDVATTTITVAWATEFEDLVSNSGEFKSISLSGYLAGALVKVSESLINNSKFDIVGFVVDQMAFSIKRFIEDCLLNGSGSVVGLSGATNVKTAAGSTEVTSDELIELKDSVKDAFQANGIWIMSPATRTALRTLKDDVGRYLLVDDIASPFGTTLLGKPIFASDNMPDMAAGAKAIFYGDMRCLATKFSEEMSIKVLRELFAIQHAVGVVSYIEFDSKIQDQQGIAVLKMHA